MMVVIIGFLIISFDLMELSLHQHKLAIFVKIILLIAIIIFYEGWKYFDPLD